MYPWWGTFTFRCLVFTHEEVHVLSDVFVYDDVHVLSDVCTLVGNEIIVYIINQVIVYSSKLLLSLTSLVKPTVTLYLVTGHISVIFTLHKVTGFL